jgi:hypothetical protein
VKTQLLVLIFTPALGMFACNFDAAMDHYCANNPRCFRDAGVPGPRDASSNDSPVADAAGPSPDAAADLAPSPPIWPPMSCGTSNGCNGPSQICHPFAQVCLALCTSVADCPSYLDTCTEILDPEGNARTPKVCTCSSAQACNGYSAGFTCNPTDGLCERLCASTRECGFFQPMRFCDRLSGMCQSTTPSCSTNSDCHSPGQPRCDPVTLRCTGCVSNSDCSTRTDGLLTCGTNGSCVSP